MRFFQIDHSFILIFNEIECFTFYKKLLSGKKTGRCPLSYTLLYYNELKGYLFVISLVTKESAFSPRLDRMHETQTKQTILIKRYFL